MYFLNTFSRHKAQPAKQNACQHLSPNKGTHFAHASTHAFEHECDHSLLFRQQLLQTLDKNNDQNTNKTKRKVWGKRKKEKKKKKKRRRRRRRINRCPATRCLSQKVSSLFSSSFVAPKADSVVVVHVVDKCVRVACVRENSLPVLANRFRQGDWVCRLRVAPEVRQPR